MDTKFESNSLLLSAIPFSLIALFTLLAGLDTVTGRKHYCRCPCMDYAGAGDSSGNMVYSSGSFSFPPYENH